MAVTHFMERAEAFGLAAWWFVEAALALAVVLILADLAVGSLAARHARKRGGSRG